MKVINYDTKDSPNTENHLSVDTQIEAVTEHIGGNQELALEEGFAASSGIRPETAETGGRLEHPEMLDDTTPDPVPDSIEEENAGLADD